MQPVLHFQRLSNFTPLFTDQELITIYLFGQLQGFSQMRYIYNHIQQHWRAWFPDVPSYQAFSHRFTLDSH